METQDSSDAQTIAVAPEAENVNVVTSPVSQMEPFHQKTAFSGFRASAPGRFWRSLSSRWSDIKATTFGPIGVCTLPTKLHLVLTSDIVTSPFQKYERYYSYTGLGWRANEGSPHRSSAGSSRTHEVRKMADCLLALSIVTASHLKGCATPKGACSFAICLNWTKLVHSTTTGIQRTKHETREVSMRTIFEPTLSVLPSGPLFAKVRKSQFLCR